MPRSQRNDNFIDKTFTVVADILIKVLPTSNREKLLLIIAMVCRLKLRVSMLKRFKLLPSSKTRN
jgi:hypothetical protein